MCVSVFICVQLIMTKYSAKQQQEQQQDKHAPRATVAFLFK